jgi:AcrR family transcriptional regulator
LVEENRVLTLPSTSDKAKETQRTRRLETRVKQEAEEKQRLLDSARHVLHEHGVSGMTVRDVLSDANLGTRAFYRHFASKDELVEAMFTAAAAQEADRLKRRMAIATDPLAAVIAWIDGRLDLAFDRRVLNRLRDLSTEAELRRGESPAELHIALDLMLAPLVEQLCLGQRLGVFTNVDPDTDARFIHNVVYGVVELQWSGFPQRRRDARSAVLRFCLTAIGASVVTADPAKEARRARARAIR